MTSFILSGITSDFVTCNDSVILDPNKNYEAALLSLDNYNSIPNISKYLQIFQMYKVDFSVINSIGSVLGFDAKVIGQGYNESTNIVNIMQINSILVNIYIIMGSYVNGSQSPTLY